MTLFHICLHNMYCNLYYRVTR